MDEFTWPQEQVSDAPDDYKYVNHEVYTVTYNKAEDGLPREIVEPESWN